MKKMLIVFAVMALAACANTKTDPRPMPQYAYKKYPPVMLNVASIQVEDYTPSMQAPNVEHLMPQPLPAAVSDWAYTHFKPVGSMGTLYITVKDASMVGSDLKRSSGIKGVFTIDQAERYDARVMVEFRTENLGTNGNGVVRVERGMTVAEDASLQDRDRVWTKMAEDIMVDLDGAAMTMLQNRLPFLLQH